MTDIDTPQGGMSASRRALLKGAVGAGVGLAAWSAPKIGSIPAYALTNSSGVFNMQCYSFNWFDGPGPGPDNWNSGSGPGTANSQGGTALARTFTWNNVFGAGNNLVVTATGSANGTAALAMVGAPAGCAWVRQGTGFYTTGAYTVGATGCTPSSATKTGTVTLSGTTGTAANSANNTADNYIIFNVVCN